MAKGTVVRGTPVHVVRSGGSGIAPGKPAGYSGTSRAREPGANFTSDQRGYQSDPREGTAYNSDPGNAGDARRVDFHERYGRVIDPAGGDMSDPRSNGEGVIFDGANRAETGHMPSPQPHLDSPVPKNAPRFDPGFMVQENRAHLGSGNESAALENLMEIGGVMSRGMVGSSSRHGPEDELTQDDIGLKGHATQSQPRGSVKHGKSER